MTLSPRELAVLRLVADGCPDKDIAARQRLSERQVRRVVLSACRKLEAQGRAAAVAAALRGGLLS